jgi:hypothetical protein
MEEKIAIWSVATLIAGVVALFNYGCVMDSYEPESIREATETGIVFAFLCILATICKG